MKNVVLHDKTEILISDDQATRLENALSNTEGFVTIGEHIIKKTTIAMIRPGVVTEVDIPREWVKGIPIGNVCHAEKSIQREINNIARNEHPTEWARVIRNKKWREKTRQDLWKITEDWCDYRAKTCGCEKVAK